MYNRNNNQRGQGGRGQAQGKAGYNNSNNNGKRNNKHKSNSGARNRDAINSYQHADSGKKKFVPRQPGQRPTATRADYAEANEQLVAEKPDNQFRIEEGGRRVTLRVTPDVAYNEERLKRVIADEMHIDVRTITALRTRKRSIDARQRTI